MCQFLETIKCLDGKLFHLSWHNYRMNRTRNEALGISEEIDLAKHIEIPRNCHSGLFRCRVTYTQKIEKIEFLSHTYRKIKSLKLVRNDEIDYHLKYANRIELQRLYEKKENCDDILIIKNGCVTDSFTANPVFFDGEKWWTPNTPLLKGTQRERLLNENKIVSCKITPETISKYKKVGLINTMQDFENMPLISVRNIKF